MKTKGQISQKLKQARYRHLKRELENLLSVKPSNCKNQVETAVPRGNIGICRLDCQVCDSARDRSDGCVVFVPKHDRESLKQSLKSFFHTAQVHEIAVRFPDVAAMSWVLDEDEEPGDLVPGALLVQIPVLGVETEVEAWVDSEWEKVLIVEAHQKAREREGLLEALEDQDAVLEKVRDLLGEKDVLSSIEKVLKEGEDKARSLADCRRQLIRLKDPLPIRKPWWKLW